MLTTPQISLYDRDFCLWIELNIALLESGHLDEIDIKNLIEELRGLANRDKKELESRLKVLFAHLLKRLYANSTRDNDGWEVTIREQRSELEILLNHSPSLRNYFVQIFAKVWEKALAEVREDYPSIAFPDKWQFSGEIDALLTEKFWEYHDRH